VLNFDSRTAFSFDGYVQDRAGAGSQLLHGFMPGGFSGPLPIVLLSPVLIGLLDDLAFLFTGLPGKCAAK
jgi:hypothetical protein